MHEHSGPQSGLVDEDMRKGQKEAIKKRLVRAKRSGKAVELYDADGNFGGAMRASQFDRIKEDFQK